VKEKVSELSNQVKGLLVGVIAGVLRVGDEDQGPGVEEVVVK